MEVEVAPAAAAGRSLRTPEAVGRRERPCHIPAEVLRSSPAAEAAMAEFFCGSLL